MSSTPRPPVWPPAARCWPRVWDSLRRKPSSSRAGLRVGTLVAAAGFALLVPDLGLPGMLGSMLVAGLGMGTAMPGYTAAPAVPCRIAAGPHVSRVNRSRPARTVSMTNR